MSLRNLSNEKLISGISKAYANAESLLNDAYILGESKKFPRAYTLCQLAIEEFSKVPLLFSTLMQRLEGSDIEYEKYDGIFTNHTLKTELGIEWEISMFEYFKKETGEVFVDKIIEGSKKYLSNLKKLNDLKNESLYVSIKNSDFQSPSEVIDETKYHSIMGTASLRQLMLQALAKLNVEDIDKLKLAINKKTEDNTN